MAKRRNVLVGLGALAMGSGALITQAAFESDTELSEADFRVIAAANLVVRRGDDSAWEGSSLAFSELGPEDVPAAAVDSGFNEDLTVNVARRNAANEQVFSHLLEVENQDGTSHEVAIGFTGFGEDVDDSANWDPAGDSSNLNAGDVAEMFRFRAESSGGTTTWISPDTEDSEYEDTITISSGEVYELDLVTDQSNNQVRAVNKKAGAAGGDNPFSGPDDPTPVDLLDNIEVGIVGED